MSRQEALLELVPREPDWKIDWKRIESSGLSAWIEKMRNTGQNPIWHGEGDVWTHTKMVCEALVSMKEYQRLTGRKRGILFLAALLHDVGKIPCTRMENGIWISPGHGSVGARMAREILWLEYGCCGEMAWTEFREAVCTLIRFHSLPVHILEQQEPERHLIKIAACGRLAPDFSVEDLCLLARADIKGRICPDQEEGLEAAELCRLQAQEYGCLRSPVEFPDDFSEYAYLSGRKICPGQKLYNDTWGEVLLMSGLPGTGKDTWLRESCGEIPVVSLDEWRSKLNILPEKDQGPVLQAAREQVKEYLRRKVPFVWNATSLSPAFREKQVQLFTDYHASVKILYLETEWEEEKRRNQERKACVPEKVIRHMLGRMTLPERPEAHKVEWRCV